MLELASKPTRGQLQPRLDTGLTLIELMVTLVVLAIGSTIAVSSYRSVTASARLNATAQELGSSLELSLSVAISRARPTTICRSMNGTSCSTGNNQWNVGWIVWVDENQNSVLDSGELNRVYPATSASIGIDGPLTAVTYSATGIPSVTPAFQISHTDITTTRQVCIRQIGKAMSC